MMERNEHLTLEGLTEQIRAIRHQRFKNDLKI